MKAKLIRQLLKLVISTKVKISKQMKEGAEKDEKPIK
jgi:hypothetical protein